MGKHQVGDVVRIFNHPELGDIGLGAVKSVHDSQAEHLGIWKVMYYVEHLISIPNFTSHGFVYHSHEIQATTELERLLYE